MNCGGTFETFCRASPGKRNKTIAEEILQNMYICIYIFVCFVFSAGQALLPQRRERESVRARERDSCDKKSDRMSI